MGACLALAAVVAPVAEDDSAESIFKKIDSQVSFQITATVEIKTHLERRRSNSNSNFLSSRQQLASDSYS